MKTERSGTERILLIAVGWACVALGTVGIFVPLLPTTCFLLGAGWCFSRSSPRFEKWLYENRMFGEYLRAYKTQRVLPSRIKFGSLATLWVSMAASVLLLTPPVWVDALLLAIASAVTLHVGRLRTPETVR